MRWWHHRVLHHTQRWTRPTPLRYMVYCQCGKLWKRRSKPLKS